MSKREAILKSLERIPPLPAAVGKSLALLGDPDVDLSEMARAIELDPGLTANILRLANSSALGSMRSIGTVREALVRLGAKRVGQLVMAAGAAPQLSPETIGYDLPPGALLEHSIATALAAEELARACKIPIPEHAFTAGLLATVGKTVLAGFLNVDVTPILELAHSEMIPFQEAERRILGIDHAEVGALLLERWNLPASIVDVVRNYLTPDDYPGVNTTLDLVHAGEALAKLSSIALGVDGLHYHPSTLVVERLGLTPEIVETVMASVVDKAAELREALGA